MTILVQVFVWEKYLKFGIKRSAPTFSYPECYVSSQKRFNVQARILYAKLSGSFPLGEYNRKKSEL